MDWQRSLAGAGQLLLCLLMSFTLTHAWSRSLAATATPAASASASDSASAGWSPVVAAAKPATPSMARQLNQISPYLDLALCSIRAEPWTCARQRSARILDVWDAELSVQWQNLKVEADRQLNATIEKRGYSASELPIGEKPSTLLKKIEIGTKYMKEYLAETMDGFLGREYEYLEAPKATSDDDDDDDDERDAEAETEGEEEEETHAADSGDTGEEEEEEETDASTSGDRETSDAEEEDEETEDEHENESVPIVTPANVEATSDDEKSSVFSTDTENTSSAVEFIELEEGEENAAGALKKPGGGGKRKKKNKNKRKKKGQQQQQPATLVVVQSAPEHHEVDAGHESGSSIVSHGGGGHGGHGGGKPFKRKQKRAKRKKKHQQATALAHESDDTLGFELLDELVSSGVGGGIRRHKFPTNYGRSNGVTRGKKKKKKKAIAKLALIGTVIKAKIELLLKILGAHLQIKFFAIALIGLLINIARFWIDVKRGGTPAKVVYVEHAHHQHHYEDHGEDWGGEQGSYWKRSLQTDPSIEDSDSSTDSYQLRPQQQRDQPQDAHYLAYRNQYQWQ